MRDDEELEDQLRRMGQVPVPPDVAASHRQAIARVTPAARGPRFGWRAVALAAFVGFFAGSTALASAGSLPAPAQDVAHDALGAVGIDVPRSTEGCPDGKAYRNHGEYVSEVEAAGGDVQAAARSRCGKPEPAGKHKDKDKDKTSGKAKGAAEADKDGDPCTGPPPWAGTALDAEAKAAARAARAEACGTGDTEDADDEAPTVTDQPAERRAPTTTAPPDTTTTTPTDGPSTEDPSTESTTSTAPTDTSG